MRKTIIATSLFLLLFLASCTTTTVTCGEGTIIQNGKCVAPGATDTPNDDNKDVTCNIEGTSFYNADFNDLKTKFVDNESGNPHTKDNFVIWGQSDIDRLLTTASVSNGSLVIDGNIGTQVDPYYNTGLGYQFFNLETDATYTACAIVEGPTGQYITSEFGIYYGHGTRDDVLLTGDKQIIIQDFKPSLTTNTDFGQFVIYLGNITGTVKIHQIHITKTSE